MFRRTSPSRRAVVWLLTSASALSAADAKPVARVGSEAVSAAALSRRLASIPDFQRNALADTPEKLKRQVLETELIPELLYAAEAQRLELGERPEFRKRERELLRDTLDRELRRDSARREPVTLDEIRAYFDANRSRFETPRRLRVWRILVADEALARKIISESKGTAGVQRWHELSREHSLDKATHLRDGDLGFIHPDGNTDTPTLRVDPRLFAAADKLADGELALEPLQMGEHWAVIWRRGSLKAVARTLAQEEGAIRQVLSRQRLERAREALLVELSRKYSSAPNERLLDSISFKDEGLPVRQSAARPAHPATAGSSTPAPGERGER